MQVKRLGKQAHPIWNGILYVLLVLVFAGGAGIWLPLVLPERAVGVDAVLTFVMAALTPIGADLVLRTASNVTTQTHRMVLLVACAAAALLALAAFFREKEAPLCWYLASIAIVISIGVWLSIYINHPMFDEPPPSPPEPEIPGGHVQAPDQLAGEGVA